MKVAVEAAALVWTLVFMAGCGDDPSNSTLDEPDSMTIESQAQLRTVTLPDGREIECLVYRQEGYGGTSHTTFDCNWEMSTPPLNG